MKMHVSIRVSNLKESLDFYTVLFGEKPHKTRPGYANFDLQDPQLKFALVEQKTVDAVIPSESKLDHLGFQVSSLPEVLRIKERLIAAGLATFDEMDTTCCYAKQDKIWAHDPDGNEWEIYVLTDNLDNEDAHDHTGKLLNPNEEAPVAAPAHRGCDSC